MAVYVWKNSDDLIQTKILQDFAKAAPDLELKISQTVLHSTHSATLAGIKILERTTRRELFRAKELSIELDPTELLERHNPVVNKIHLRSADILLTRLEDGRWNWQQYTFHPPEKKTPVLPHIVLEDLRIQLTLKHGNNIPTAHLPLTSPKIQAVPASLHAYDFDGAITLPGAGLLNLSGLCDLNSGEWKIGGNV